MNERDGHGGTIKKKKVMEKDHKYEYFLKVCVTFTWAYNILNNGHAY